MLKLISLLALTTFFSVAAHAVKPLHVISPNDKGYAFYSAVANMDQKLVNERVIETYYDIDHQDYRIAGRLVPLANGTGINSVNLVLSVNGNLYFVDALLSSVDAVKIRRRWRDNPEPGTFLRVDGRRVNEDRTIESISLWIKVATPEGRALPVLKLLEGNYDIAGSHFPEPNPGPVLPPPGLQRAADALELLESADVLPTQL